MYNKKLRPTHMGIDMMKRYRYLFALPIALAVMMTSCTEKDNDEINNNNPSSDTRRIEKMTSISYSDNGDYTVGSKRSEIAEWDGDKLKKITPSSGWMYVFNYNGDKLIESVMQDPNYGNVLCRFTYSYTNDLLTEVDGPGGHFQINYNDDGYVVSASYIGSDYRNETYQLTWQDGNLVKYVHRYERDTSRYTNTVTFTYDNKKTWRTGLGVTAFCHYNFSFSPSGLESKNNVLSETYHTAWDSGGEYTWGTNYNYTYNGDYVISYDYSRSDGQFPSTNYLKYTNSSDPAPTTYKVTAQGVYSKGSVKGGGDYVSGKTVKLLAQPNEGYHFAGWSNGSISNPLTFTVTNDVEYQATFEAD